MRDLVHLKEETQDFQLQKKYPKPDRKTSVPHAYFFPYMNARVPQCLTTFQKPALMTLGCSNSIVPAHILKYVSSNENFESPLSNEPNRTSVRAPDWYQVTLGPPCPRHKKRTGRARTWSGARRITPSATPEKPKNWAPSTNATHYSCSLSKMGWQTNVGEETQMSTGRKDTSQARSVFIPNTLEGSQRS